MPDKIKVLILGSGGREHALGWKINRSPLVAQVFCAPGNGGIPSDMRPILNLDDFAGIADFCKREQIDLVVVGPEAPLCAGIVDYLAKHGVKAFGPSKIGARLEGSKIHMKTLCQRLGIPTAEFDFSGDYKVSEKIIKQMGGELVIKADGLCAGKGVAVTKNTEEALQAAREAQVEKKFGKEGICIVIERKLVGRECSFMVLADGTENCIVLPMARDYKRAEEGDRGENTGGMGAYSPLPDVDESMIARIKREIIVPVLCEMAKVGAPYHGVLYAGIMLTADGPKLLEFNVRFGDPEMQVILPRIESDIVPYLIASIEIGGFADLPPINVSPQSTVGTVATAHGYPGTYEKGHAITGIAEAFAAQNERLWVFHAGTEWKDGVLVTSGGRVLITVAMGWTIPMARIRSKDALDHINFAGMTYRRDIAYNVG